MANEMTRLERSHESVIVSQFRLGLCKVPTVHIPFEFFDMSKKSSDGRKLTLLFRRHGHLSILEAVRNVVALVGADLNVAACGWGSSAD